jgi:hypothetical protein
MDSFYTSRSKEGVIIKKISMISRSIRNQNEHFQKAQYNRLIERPIEREKIEPSKLSRAIESFLPVVNDGKENLVITPSSWSP